VNELVNNAAKHGGMNNVVRLRREVDQCTLEVEDDGPGFPPAFDPEVHSHQGLDLVMTLARWDLQGSITFGNRPVGGGRVVVRFEGGETPGDEDMG
jgi:two-component sensor histidine kinase